MVQLKIGAALFNKRAKATTASDVPVLPAMSSSANYKPSGPEEMYPYIKLPIEYQAQKHVNMCGDACINMLFTYHGRPAPVNLSVNVRGIMEGTDAADLEEAYGKEGLAPWRPSWRPRGGNFDLVTPMRLAAGLHQKGPFIWSGSFARFMGKRWSHWIIVHGIVNETVLIADPWHGENRAKPFSWFHDHMTKAPKDSPFFLET